LPVADLVRSNYAIQRSSYAAPATSVNGVFQTARGTPAIASTASFPRRLREAAHELSRVDRQRGSEFCDVQKRRIALPSLDTPDITAVQTSLVGELLLGQSGPFAQAANLSPERVQKILDHDVMLAPDVEVVYTQSV
jgi:hypothetical protein